MPPSAGAITAHTCLCPQPPEDVPGFKAEPMTQLIKEMLREKLSFRIIEAILDAGERRALRWYRAGGTVWPATSPFST